MPRVYVSIGTNQQRERNLRMAVAELSSCFHHLRLSAVYETASVGFEGDAFYNLVAGFDTNLPLEALVDRLREIEALCGRQRVEKRYGPRTMDIDVLTYGDHISDDDAVEVPRSEMLSQAYVLRPLAELAPEARHPTLGESYADLRRRLALDEADMAPVAFDPRTAQPAQP